MPLDVNTLLRTEGIDPADCSVILHLTNLEPLRRMLPWIVGERPELFDAYQSVHSRQAVATLRARSYALSFVPVSRRTMTLAGLYRIARFEDLPALEIYSDPRFAELESDYGASDISPGIHIGRGEIETRFTLEQIDALADLAGRLNIAVPAGRAYVRIAANLDAPILGISEAAAWSAGPPDWRGLVISAGEVRGMPNAWRDRLSQWRGVYLILDRSDGGRYVGSAYGRENLLGRWLEHVRSDVGVTAELSCRNPNDFQFSILERVSPDAEASDVVALEHTWMNRLATREYGLNA